MTVLLCRMWALFIIALPACLGFMIDDSFISFQLCVLTSVAGTIYSCQELFFIALEELGASETEPENLPLDSESGNE